MREQASAYLQFTPARSDDRALDAAIAHFADKDRRETFFRFFKQIESLYEIISPDASRSVRDFVADYARLADLYAKIRLHFSLRVLGEFVIVHELLHLRVPNHGKLFKSLLSAYVPAWETYENRRGSSAT